MIALVPPKMEFIPEFGQMMEMMQQGLLDERVQRKNQPSMQKPRARTQRILGTS